MNIRFLPRLNFTEEWLVRLALLIGQSVSMGVTLSLLIVLGNSIFLAEFGPQTLPYVYLTVAVIASLLVYGLAALQRRWVLPHLAMATIAVLSVFYFVCWLGITLSGFRWLSFALVVSFSFVIQIGFVFLGGQAGRLFDVRQIKRLFPQVVAGFVVGFVLGAFIAPLLIRLLGSTERALIGLTGSTLIWLLFLALTNRRYHLQFGPAKTGQERKQAAVSLRQALSKRTAVVIVLYLMLAAIVNQLSDFMMMAQVGARYPNAESLAQFFSSFTVGLNLSDLLFTTLIAGFLLSRFGLRLGLSANPAVMLLLFASMAVVGVTFGLSSGLFFALAVSARVVMITLEDGMSRSSTNAAYQAIPVQERGLVQTGVEGIGVPLALGIAGILLLGFNVLPGLTLHHLTVLTWVLAAGWLTASVAVYRSYKNSLVETLRRQALPEGDDLYLEDAAARSALLKLLHSGNIHDVRFAFDVLERGPDPLFENNLLELLDHTNEAVRIEALERVEKYRPMAALPGVEVALQSSGSIQLKGAALRALSALHEGDADERVIRHLDDPSPQLRLAALVGLLRYGGLPGALAAGQRLMELSGSSCREERLMLAQVIGEIGERSLYRLLMPLLDDPDAEIRSAALQSAGRLQHPALLQLVLDRLSVTADRAAAMAALGEYGPGILPAAEEFLRESQLPGDDRAIRQVVRLVRLCGQISGPPMQRFLAGQLRHPVDDIRHQVYLALQSCGYRADEEDLPLIQQALADEAACAARLLAVRRDLGEAEALVHLVQALEDELASTRQRLFLLLSFLFDPRSIVNAERRLASPLESEQALALEALDVILPATLKPLVLPLVDTHMPLSQRIHRLNRQHPLPQQIRQERLEAIIDNPENVWQTSWVQTCAIYAAGNLLLSSCRSAMEKASASSDATVRETSAWALDRLSSEAAGVQ